MSYLTNPICAFIPHFKVSKRQDIVSASLFKMKRGYKSFAKYLTGLKDMIGVFRGTNFKIRLFVDGSVVDDKEVKRIIDNDVVQLVEYRCPEFMEDDHHRGTFGTLVRLFPLFDFDDNDAGDVMVLDVDHSRWEYEERLKVYREAKRLGKDLVYEGNLFLMGDKVKYPLIFAGRLYGFKRLPHEKLTHFMENIEEANKVVLNKVYIKEGQGEGDIKYGIDEVFLNLYLVDDLVKEGFKIMAHVKYSLSHFFYYGKIMDEDVRDIMGDKYDNKKSVKDNIKWLDGLLYKPKNLTPDIVYIVDRFYGRFYGKLKMEEPLLSIVKGLFNGVVREECFVDLKFREKVVLDVLQLGGYFIKKYHKYKKLNKLYKTL